MTKLTDHLENMVYTAFPGLTGAAEALEDAAQINTAPEILLTAADLIDARGKERDQDGGERSMARCVAMFNAKYGTALTEEQGWCFMVFLNHSRMMGGAFRREDYDDAVAYEALMAEAAVRDR